MNTRKRELREIKICPFRTYTETRPAIMVGHGDVVLTGFMGCLKAECPAWYSEYEQIPASTKEVLVEHCRRLENGKEGT